MSINNVIYSGSGPSGNNDHIFNIIESGDSTTSMTPSSNLPPLHPSTSQSQPQEPSEPMTKKAKQTSEIWVHFTQKIVTKTSKDGKSQKNARVAECNYCKQQLTNDVKNGITHIRRHSEICQRRPNLDRKQQLLTSAFSGSGPSGLIRHKFDPKKYRESLAKMIIEHEYPFNMVSHKGFIEYSRTLEPQFKMVTHNTIKSDYLQMYKEEKIKLSKVFENIQSKISLTSDMWTSNQTIGYMAITAHFIDSDWNLQKRIINFVNVDPPHTGLALAKIIRSNLIKWKIDDKIFCLTLDNCSTNDVVERTIKMYLVKKGLPLEGKFFHMRCSAHIINLVVQIGLEEINHIIKKIRETVKFIKNSASRIHKFREFVNELGLSNTKGLPLDVSTRWNSTHLMLEASLEFKDVFSRIEIAYPSYTGNPSEEDWSRAIMVNEFLKKFYDATNKFSGNKFPTVYLFLPEVVRIHTKLIEKLEDENDFFRNMAIKMKQKFDDYWMNYNPIFDIAVLFDPQRKDAFLKYVFKKLFILNEEEAKKRKDEVIKNFRSLYVEYSKKFSTYDTTISNVVDVSEMNDEDEDWLNYEKELNIDEETIGSKSELDLYLEEPRDKSTPFDILLWWKVNSSKYPILSKMARDILAIPVSTVTSESAFSTGGRELDQFRSCLKPKTVEALVCCQDWIRSTQVNDSLDISNLDVLKEDVDS